ncbi:ATP-dependent DNA helicase PIF1 [Apostasia shenzhenica]|uniref:ATP-dependent DNA helicase PIF1 n=1 Tax=Apostasia shenzhenica TaxID=1088818 RepID=A0A2I0ASH3_9ASPA|nr:ATP-dependent DNA helicase PIF1 [Apostasia shenzhenica]
MLINPFEGLQGLIKEIYPNLNSKTFDPNYLKIRAILAPRNEEIDYINNTILSEIKSDKKIYRSADIIIPQNDEKFDQETLYTPEFLNSLTLPSLPPHSLQLKNNTPILLLRNLDQRRELCNGTKLIVKNLGQRVIEAQITIGSNIQENVIIPRISMTSKKNDMPFILKRKQLPIQIAYAMTKIKVNVKHLIILVYIYIHQYFHMDNYMLQFLELRQLLL